VSERFLFSRTLTQDELCQNAALYVGTQLKLPSEGFSGPQLGNFIESNFMEYLKDLNFHLPKKTTCDFGDMNIDLKCLQVKGKRGGAAKIHGNSRNGSEPVYDLLVMTYSLCLRKADGIGVITIEGAFFIPCERVTWVRAEHYLFSIPDRFLKEFSCGWLER